MIWEASTKMKSTLNQTQAWELGIQHTRLRQTELLWFLFDLRNGSESNQNGWNWKKWAKNFRLEIKIGRLWQKSVEHGLKLVEIGVFHSIHSIWSKFIQIGPKLCRNRAKLWLKKIKIGPFWLKWTFCFPNLSEPQSVLKMSKIWRLFIYLKQNLFWIIFFLKRKNFC